MASSFVKSEPKMLRDLGVDERWPHERIAENPSILGVGDLTLIERERIQSNGGRLDMLLSDPEEGIRYEVELMLGRLDESHIIRTIEYWDIERTCFPQLEHRAVIVAEDITNSFFHIISLLNRAVPIIAIQMNALHVDKNFVLSFTKVLDIAELYGEDETAVGQVDRSYWERNSNPTSMSLVDRIISLIPASLGAPKVTYNKNHIALGTSGRNFVWLHPRKSASYCHTDVLLDADRKAEWLQKLEESGVYATSRRHGVAVRLSSKEITASENLIRELIAESAEYARS